MFWNHDSGTTACRGVLRTDWCDGRRSGTCHIRTADLCPCTPPSLCLSRLIDGAAADVFGLILPYDLERNRLSSRNSASSASNEAHRVGTCSSQRLSALTLLRGLSAIWQR